MYTALVLDDKSQSALKSALSIPDGWEVVCHHMTINMGNAASGPAANLLGQTFSAIADFVASDDKVMAVAVSTDAPSKNDTKHITVAVNRAAGGKPFHSNKLKNWIGLPNGIKLVLQGTIQECE